MINDAHFASWSFHVSQEVIAYHCQQVIVNQSLPIASGQSQYHSREVQKLIAVGSYIAQLS